MGAHGLEGLEGRFMLAGDLTWARQLRDPDLAVRAVDPSGNVLLSAGYGLQKWSPTGRVSWIWSRSVHPIDVDTDAAGNIYVCGLFSGERDLDPTRGRTIIATGRRTLPHEQIIGQTDFETDAFVAKLNPAGGVIWAKSLPSSGFKESAMNIGVDDAGEVTVSGRFAGRAVFSHADGTRQVMRAQGLARDHGMAQDAFVWRLDSAGNSLWARQLDVGVEHPVNMEVPTHAMDVDPDGNVYLGGGFSGTVDFDPSKQGRAVLKANRKIRDGADGVLLKLDPGGNFVWARRTGGVVSHLAVDDAGNPYAVGWVSGTIVMDAAWGARRFSGGGGLSYVVYKATPDGRLAWAGQTSATVMDFSVAGDGDVYLTGEYGPIDDFDLGTGRMDVRARQTGLGDAFVWKVDSDGVTEWVRNLGGNERDVGYSVAAGPNDTVHVGGMFFGRADLDPGRGKTIFEVTSVGVSTGGPFPGGHVETFNNGFVVKLRD